MYQALLEVGDSTPMEFRSVGPSHKTAKGAANWLHRNYGPMSAAAYNKARRIANTETGEILNPVDYL